MTKLIEVFAWNWSIYEYGAESEAHQSRSGQTSLGSVELRLGDAPLSVVQSSVLRRKWRFICE
ncbi:hypothetical protein OKW50_008035 [Paraburkholderia youngii]